MLKKSASALKRATDTPSTTGAIRSSTFGVRRSENLGPRTLARPASLACLNRLSRWSVILLAFMFRPCTWQSFYSVPQLLWITLWMRSLSREKWPTLRDLVAVCLKSGHCGLSSTAPIFCGLTDQSFLFPPSVVPWRFYADFLLEADLLLWGATKKPTLIHSSASVQPRDERGGRDWRESQNG